MTASKFDQKTRSTVIYKIWYSVTNCCFSFDVYLDTIDVGDNQSVVFIMAELIAGNFRLEGGASADVTTRTVSLHIRVEMLIAFQANYEVTSKRRHFYKITLYY